MKTLPLRPARAEPAPRPLGDTGLPTPRKSGNVQRHARLQPDRDQLDEVSEVHGWRRHAALTTLDTGNRPSDRAAYCWSGVGGLNASHETFGFQFVNVPLGLSFHAHTCS